MVVDDSAVVRGIIARTLEQDVELQVVATCPNGEQAVRLAPSKDCDVIVLDIEMPVMDGLTALPQLLKVVPGVQVVMSSTLTRRNADISLKALSLGAADYVTKPDTLSQGTSADQFKGELVRKVKALGKVRKWRQGKGRRLGSDAPTGVPTAVEHGVAIRPMPLLPAEVLAIGCSTGGPQALVDILGVLGRSVRVPIVITQHMPPTFTAILAENLGRVTGLPSAEGQTGMVLKAGSIYVAPGDWHMELAKGDDGQVRIALSKSAPENYCRPAVDPMFRSVASVYGSRVAALVLTGMGCDGREGARAIVAAGGAVFAQDEATSVVWGMPGAVANAGLCSGVWPKGRIGYELSRFVKGTSRAA